ncbi:MAG: dephospho-CoA kinase [Blastocatellia bacterium]|nr:dephospho-CoA kinase [Blastocatellia bacterium]
MLKVGLTGGIATGKSNVLRLLRELGCLAMDADKAAHQAIEPGQPAYTEIVDCFGKEILDPAGRIDRARLGAIVFNDQSMRVKLNSIVHPRVFAAQERWFAEVEERDPGAIALVDAALMIETGSYRRYDKVIVVHCRPDLQLQRLMARNNLTREDAAARISAQMPSSEKLKYADFAVDTSNGFEDTRAQVESLYSELHRLAGSGRN